MAVIDSEEGFAPCPDSVAVIGGGRWARVLTGVLCDIVPPSVRISVHSVHNAKSMFVWRAERGLSERIHLSSEWPRFAFPCSSAVIVANAARDHERAVDWTLSSGVPVMVEKPIAITSAASQRLAEMSHSRNTRFAAAHIFLFSRYLENFSKLVADAGSVQFLRVYWTDTQSEKRYGEQKQYDPSLPVFADWLPHVLSMIGTLIPGLPQRCEKLKFLRGGAHLELDLMLGDIPCSVQLIRNSDQRRRIIEVSAGQKMLQLNFSKEPGIITSDSATTVGDPNWEVKRRPAARMLTAFLTWAAGGVRDSRLDVEIGLRANQVIDETLGLYRLALLPWLIARLSSHGQVDEDLRYALSELLQSEGLLSSSALDRGIERLLRQFWGACGTHWTRELARARDPVGLLRTIAM